MTPRAPSLALAAALLLVAPGCRKSGPEETYRAFAEALRAGEAQKAWSLLSEGSRQALDRRAAELARETGGVVRGAGVALLVGSEARRAPRIASVTVVREGPDEAVLRVADESGDAREVAMAREGGGWRVVLPSDI
ncbi:MAG TPA: hypothetical protein VLS93_06385 [Anaeromyxobacteraceae bacterium]|nr:hypothetical protein [Anaeromyxobacteraceae bacterium]